MKFHVPDMSCGHCTAAIGKSIKAADPAARVETDLANKVVTVETTSTSDSILQSIRSAGYDAVPV